MKTSRSAMLKSSRSATGPPVVAAFVPKPHGKLSSERVIWLARSSVLHSSPWVTCPVSRIPGRWSGACLAGSSVSTSVSAPPQSTTDSMESVSGIPVNMTVQFESSFGEVLKVVGSSPALGGWGVASAPMMAWSPGHVWQLQVLLEPGQVVEYKLARQTGNGVTWEEGPNRQLKVPKRLLLDDEEFGGSTLISANLVWGDVAASTVQIVVQQPSLSSVDLPDGVPAPKPPSASVAAALAPVQAPPTVPPPPPLPVAAEPAPAAAGAGEGPRGSRFQANLARTPGVTAPPALSAPATAGSSVADVPPLDPSLPSGALIQPEAKPVKFRFKRLGSFDELQAEQSQSNAIADLPTMEGAASAAAPSSQPAISSVPPAAEVQSMVDVSATSAASSEDIPAEVKETPVSFRFRRLSSQTEEKDADTNSNADSNDVDGSLATASAAVAENTISAEPTSKTEMPSEPTLDASGDAATVSREKDGTQAPASASEENVEATAARASAVEKNAEEKQAEASTSAEVVSQLNSLLEDNQAITGPQLRKMVYSKWKRHYDVQLTKLSGRMYFQVMWKFLEQKSFPMTEAQYDEKLDAIAYCLSEWGVVEIVMAGIDKARGHPGHTTGGGARCISIPLGVDLDGARRKEFSSSRR